MKRKAAFSAVLLCLLVLLQPAFSVENGLSVKRVRYFSYASFTRIVFEIEAAAPYVLTKNADGRAVLFTAYDGPLVLKSPLPALRDGVVNGMETKEEAGRFCVVIGLDAAAGEVKDFVLRGPDRIVLDIARGGSREQPAADPVPSVPEERTVVVLDPGHGGKDSGIVTGRGQEKSVALDIAFAIKKILQKNPRLKVLLTRERDHAATLDERAASANAAGAHIFVAVHTAPGPGLSVFIQDPDEDIGGRATRSAARDFLSFASRNERQEKLWGRQQAAHAKESGALGRTIAGRLRGKDSEPVQAPIAGLRAVNAAAALVEVGMEVNRARAAEAVARGIEHHVRENR